MQGKKSFSMPACSLGIAKSILAGLDHGEKGASKIRGVLYSYEKNHTKYLP